MSTCPECGSKLIRCENVAERHDELRCVVCSFVEPVCGADTCGGL